MSYILIIFMWGGYYGSSPAVTTVPMKSALACAQAGLEIAIKAQRAGQKITSLCVEDYK